ncbi:dihydrofolate reductase [Pseudoalteromonas sp. OFAV1]|uniref:dihydrofolate reductase n=1 Tax=Pseudoalteromonas sp. OFAV1 TaxID=2908892 RepID=UPI001F368B63|nr:dihydrofolate reductase [Pseudoalteromonas sp. OFAV1]MCF2903202.1 dihydrofolate reductase [Pseudoalteromonas sp. OFAV1]
MELIVAHANNFAIGKNNRLPWKCPADMKFFVAKSKEKVDLLMGKTTANGIGILPERNIHILSTTTEGALASIEEVLAFNKDTPLLICGGADVYRQFLPYVSRMYVTSLDVDIDGADTFFPDYTAEFEETLVIDEGESNNITYKISVFERKTK